MKNYRKVKRPETKVAESIRRFTFLSGAKLLLFVLWNSIRAVWKQSPSRATNLFAKCEHGLKYILQNCVNKNVEKIYK